MKISVLTPTYNRKNLLGRLYNSLIENSYYGVDIEWLIMDDGSSDGTKEKIEELKKQNKIEIKYFHQENSGKMVAINYLAEKATGEIIIDCDDDDYFTKNAFETIKKQYEIYKQEKEIYGLCFLKYDSSRENMGNLFTKERTTMFDLYFKEGETGEKAIAFFANIRKQYKHKLEKQERFVTEARMYHEMDLKYKLVTINEPIMICEYQQEGYTKNILKQFKNNPYGYYKYFQEILNCHNMKEIPFKKRLYVIKHYILFTYLSKSKKSGAKINENFNKILYRLLYVPGIIKAKIKKY